MVIVHTRKSRSKNMDNTKMPVADPDQFPRFPETGHKFSSIDFLGARFWRQTSEVYFV